MKAKTSYVLSLSFSILCLLIAFIMSFIWPSPNGMHDPLPEYYSWIFRAQYCLLILSFSVISISGIISYLYHERLWLTRYGIPYLIQIVIGIPITIFLCLVPFL